MLSDYFQNKLISSDFVYHHDEKKFKTSSAKLIDKDSNEYKIGITLIDLNSNKIAAKDVQLYFSENGNFGKNSRLKGNFMLADNNLTIIEKGIFTTCKPRDDCPPWTMQSEKVTHNKNKKIIEYKNAWLKLYDRPVFYFPKFFHPDPTVKRQSGFLIPSIVTSSISGNSINIPTLMHSENKDFTITPRIYFNNDILLQNEYRQVNKNFDHITDFSFKRLDEGPNRIFFQIQY